MSCTATLTAVVVAVALVAVAPVPAAAAPAVCDAPVPSATRPGYLIADPDCELSGAPFTARPGAVVHTGIRDGAAYRIEVPADWNGQLVLYAHGYRGNGTTVWVDSPSLRPHYVQRGFAWAASSYQTNGYDVDQGVRDSYALIDLFREVTGTPAERVLMTGSSMGGHVTVVAIERYPRAFAGAMPACGVLGDTELFDYFLDANLTAAALAGVRPAFPAQPDEWRAQAGRIAAELGLIAGRPLLLTPAGRIWSDVVERRSGGDRPGFPAAFAYWSAARGLSPYADLPFLLGAYPGVTGAPVQGNRLTFYRSTDGPWPTLAEWRLNLTVRRVPPTGDHAAVPRVAGRPSVPVLSLHNLGDLFVPFSMEQIYAVRAARNGRSGLFVSRAIRAAGHCDFTPAELSRAFDDLVTWVDRGRRPGGDAILNRRAVADPAFGCRYTVGERPGFAAACPA
jgi:hypothetical protein